MVAVLLALAGGVMIAQQPVGSAKERGATLFAGNGCAHCHGPAGVGGEIGPDLQMVRKRMSAAQMTAQIHDGGKAMPAFGEVLNAGQIADLVAFLREKRKVVVGVKAPVH